MPLYEIKAPDGTLYDIEGATEEDAIYQAAVLHSQRFSDPFAEFNQPQAPEEQGVNFTDAISSGIDIMQGGLYSTGEGLGKATGIAGLEQWGKEGAARNVKEAQEALPYRQEFGKIEDVGDAWDWWKQTAGTSLAVSAPLIAGGALGALLPVPGGLAGGMAAGAGITALLGTPLYYGLNREAQKEKYDGKVPDEFLAFIMAPLQGAFDGVLGRVLPASFSSKLILNILAKIGVGAATESATEIAQTAAERFQLRLPLDDEDAMMQYAEAATGGAVVGGPIAGASGFFGRASQKIPGLPEGSSPERQTLGPVLVDEVGGIGGNGRAGDEEAPPLLPAPEFFRASALSDEEFTQADLDRRATAAVAEVVGDKTVSQQEAENLFKAARETISPIGDFNISDLPFDLGKRVSERLAGRGIYTKETVTLPELQELGATAKEIKDLVESRRPVTAEPAPSIKEIEALAKEKKVITRKGKTFAESFKEFARQTVGTRNPLGLTASQRATLYDALQKLPNFESETEIPWIKAPPYSVEAYKAAEDRAITSGKLSLKDIQDATRSKNPETGSVITLSPEIAKEIRSDLEKYGVIERKGNTWVKREVKRDPRDVVPPPVEQEETIKFFTDEDLSQREYTVEQTRTRGGSPVYSVVGRGYSQDSQSIDLKGKEVIAQFPTEEEAKTAVEAIRASEPAIPSQLRQRAQEAVSAAKQAAAEPTPAPAAESRLPASSRGFVANKVIPALKAQATERGMGTSGLNLPTKLVSNIREYLQEPAGPEGEVDQGVYDSAKRIILLAWEAVPSEATTDQEIIDYLSGVMDHELFHALLDARLITVPEWRTLYRYARDTINPETGKTFFQDAMDLYATPATMDNPVPGQALVAAAEQNIQGRAALEEFVNQYVGEEAVAEAFRVFAKSKAAVTDPVRNIFQRILDRLRGIARAFRGDDPRSAEEIMRAIASGEVSRRAAPQAETTPEGIAIPQMKFSRRMEFTESGFGLHQWSSEENQVALAAPRPYGGPGALQGRGTEGTAQIEYSIFAPNQNGEWKDSGRAAVNIKLNENDELSQTFEGIVDIEVKPELRGSGIASRLIDSLVQSSENGLNIYDIKESAKSFWEMLGTKLKKGTDKKIDGFIPKIKSSKRKNLTFSREKGPRENIEALRDMKVMSHFAGQRVDAVLEDVQDPMSRSTIVLMSPDDFLLMATKGFHSPGQQQVYSQNVSRGMAFDNIPYLSIENDGTGQIGQHDGRHRADALRMKAHGYSLIPVELRAANLRWGMSSVEDRPSVLVSQRDEVDGQRPRMDTPESIVFPAKELKLPSDLIGGRSQVMNVGVAPQDSTLEPIARQIQTEFASKTLREKPFDPELKRNAVARVFDSVADEAKKAGATEVINTDALGVYGTWDPEYSSGLAASFPAGTEPEQLNGVAAEVFRIAKQENQEEAFVALEARDDAPNPGGGVLRPGISIFFRSGFMLQGGKTRDQLIDLINNLKTSNIGGFTAFSSEPRPDEGSFATRDTSARNYEGMNFLWTPEYSQEKIDDINVAIEEAWDGMVAIDKFVADNNIASASIKWYHTIFSGDQDYEKTIRSLRSGDPGGAASLYGEKWRKRIVDSVQEAARRSRQREDQQQRDELPSGIEEGTTQELGDSEPTQRRFSQRSRKVAFTREYDGGYAVRINGEIHSYIDKSLDGDGWQWQGRRFNYIKEAKETALYEIETTQELGDSEPTQRRFSRRSAEDIFELDTRKAASVPGGTGDLAEALSGRYHNRYGRVVSMPIERFRNLAFELKEDFQSKNSLKLLREKAENGEKVAPPFLELTWEDDSQYWKVTNHEGRHRSIVAEENGLTEMPVVLMFKTSEKGQLKNRDFDPEFPGYLGDDVVASMEAALDDTFLNQDKTRRFSIRDARRMVPLSPQQESVSLGGDDIDISPDDGTLHVFQTDRLARLYGKEAVERERLRKKEGPDAAKPSRSTLVKTAKLIEKLAKKAGAPVIGPTDDTPENVQYVGELMAHEGIAAISGVGNASRWYRELVENAVSVASLIHPEIATDPVSRSAFAYALAVTSNGQGVALNTRYAEKVYEAWKKNNAGFMPIKGWGKEAAAMKYAFKAWNKGVKEIGLADWIEFLSKEHTVRSLREAGYTISGENIDAKVYGSAIIGPKIGQGFYQNLMGNFTPLTMDRWWMRSWGRWTNTLVERVTPKLKRERIGRFITLLNEEGNKEALKKFGYKGDVGKIRAGTAIKYARMLHKEDLKNRYFRDEKGDRLPLYMAAQRVVENKDSVLEQPKGGGHRNFMRAAANHALGILRSKGIGGNQPLESADLQALLWYPEKDFYKENGVGDRKSDPTDYEKEFTALAKKRGFSDGKIERAIQTGANRGRPRSVREIGPDLREGSEGTQTPVRDGEKRYSRRARELPAPPVNSEAFKQWFKDSKVVDERGQPLVVYFGTVDDISSFIPPSDHIQSSSLPKGMTAFSSSPQNAETYTKFLGVSSREGQTAYREEGEAFFDFEAPDRNERIEKAKQRLKAAREDVQQYGTSDETIYPVYLSLQNPLIIDAQGRPWTNVNGGGVKGGDGRFYLDLPVDGVLSPVQEKFKSINEVAAEAKEAGYDGLIVTNVIDSGSIREETQVPSDTYIAFEPTQIKSVFNQGTFDPANPDIRYSRRAKEPKVERTRGSNGEIWERVEAPDGKKGGWRLVTPVDELEELKTYDVVLQRPGKKNITRQVNAANEAEARSKVWSDPYYLGRGVSQVLRVTETKSKQKYSRRPGYRGPLATPADGRVFANELVRGRVDGLMTRLGQWDNPEELTVLGKKIPSMVDLRIKLQDKMLPIGMLQDHIMRQGGIINDDINTYMMEQLSHGKTVDEIRVRERKMYIPILEAIKNANGITRADVEDYLYARHAPYRNAYLLSKMSEELQRETPHPSGMSNAKSAEILARQHGENRNLTEAQRRAQLQDLERIADMVDEVIADTNKVRLDSGLIDLGMINEELKYWVPLRGKPEEMIDEDGLFRKGEEKSAMPRTGKKGGIRGKEDPSMKGRASEAENILGNIFMQNEEAVIRANMNDVIKSFADMIRQNSEQVRGIARIVDDYPMERKKDPKSGKIYLRANRDAVKTPNIVTFKEIDSEGNVREVHIETKDQRLAESLNGLSMPDANGTIIKALGSFNRYLARVNTSWNPEFLISNLIRDMQTAAIVASQYEIEGLSKDILTSVPNAARGISFVLRGDKGIKSPIGAENEYAEAFRELQKLGGTTEFLGIRDLNQVLEKIAKLTGEINEDTKLGKTKTKINEFFETIEDYNKVLENSLRLGAYKALVDRGASKKQAAYVAKNLTVNFNKGGTNKVAANAWFLFYNASLQGTWVLLNSMRSQRVRKIVAGVVMAGFLNDTINAIASGDDDNDKKKDYDEIDDWIKERNMILMDPTGLSGSGFLQIPMPYGFNAFFNLGRVISASIRGGMPPSEAANSAVLTMFDSFNPVGGSSSFYNFVTPTIGDPLMDIARNRDFANRSIIPERASFGNQPKEPDSQLYWGNTRTPFIAVGKWLNKLTGGNEFTPGAVDISPAHMEYVYDYLLGAAGAFVMRSYSTAFEFPIDLIRKDLEDVDLNSVIFLRKMVGHTGNVQDRRQFYRNGQDVYQAMKEYEGFRKAQNADGMQRSLEKYPEQIKIGGMFKGIDRNLSTLRERLRKIRSNQNISEKVKQRLEEQNLTEQDRLIDQANRLYNQFVLGNR